MISVFTPSHNTRFLKAAYQSLLAQSHTDWEWVILLNGPAERVHLPFADRRVRFERCEKFAGIGELKAIAVSKCKGDILVELDHDDMLTPDALAAVWTVFAINKNAVFAYSDTAQIDEDGNPDPSEFSADHGWTYYQDNGYKTASSFKPYPHNVSYIWYAPNHLRAFRRSAYEFAGGYDRSLTVLDDQDLMTRLYQIGGFHHIKKCLYLQRVHAGNTQRDPETNAKIQQQTVQMYYTDIEANALAWTRRRKLLALDLGAFHGKPSDYKGVDMREGPGVDYVGDFLDLDLPDNSVGVIRAVDFLEHVPNRIGVMEKIWRLLEHGGMLLSETPSTDGRGAWQDPTHVSGWNENSFWYFCDDRYRKYIESDAKFHVSRLETYFPSEWHQAHNISYVRANLVAVKTPHTRDFGGLETAV
jgi:SAM-dependent methyltransferase